ncbi:hypothetical protein Goarm_005060, partial [Gossypium armourianum]|nr:hypothetical protein [Gossypium armourianum]
MGHELLPKNVKIPSIKKNVGWGCLRCRGRNETAIHALKDCLKARAILSHDGIDDWLLNYDYESRNNAIFWGKKDDASEIWDRAKTL